MERSQFLRRVKFILKFGKALHAVGSPAHTLEGTMQDMCQLLGLKGTIVSLPTAIFSSFSYEDEEITKIERVEPVGVDLGKLSKVDKIAKEVIQGELSFEEGSSHLDNILNEETPYGKRVRVICFLFSAAGFMALFGGTWGDFFASILIGFLMGLISLLRPIGLVAQLFEAMVALVSALATYLLVKLFPGLNVGVIILSSLIIFMPGLFITIAIAEIATQNLTSGTSRLVGGVMILLKLTFGVFIGSKLASWFHFPSIDLDFNTIPSWFSYVMLPATALMSTVNFKAEKSDWKWVTIAGIFGYSCAKVGSEYLGTELGIFFGGACVGAVSNIFARLQNRPSSIFQFPGIILLVPGSVGYKSLSFLFENDVTQGMQTAFTMIALAMALVVGVFVGNILIKPRKSLN
ncbi:MAG: threonine/serine exporter ThrE family protein [Bacteriovoracaceae bacterium]